MAVVGMAANPLVPTEPAVIGPAEMDGACPVGSAAGHAYPPMKRRSSARIRDRRAHVSRHHPQITTTCTRLVPLEATSLTARTTSMPSCAIRHRPLSGGSALCTASAPA